MSAEEYWDIIFQWDLIAIEKHSTKWYERAVRPPWVRLILKDKDNKILITREYRSEYKEFDYRLPWGKVFDDLESYLIKRNNKTLLEKSVLMAARIEAKEEAGIDEISDLQIEHISKAWATIDWTLYYVSWNIERTSEQILKDDEREYWIEVLYLTKEEIKKLIQEWKIKEERSVWFLVPYLH